VKEQKSDVVYVVAEDFQEKLSQMVGHELHVVAKFDGNFFYMSNVLLETAIECRWLYLCN